jgi:hypothetical protein
MPPASDGSAPLQPDVPVAATSAPAAAVPRATSTAPAAIPAVTHTPVVVQQVATTTPPIPTPEPESGTIAYGFLGVAVVIVGIAAYKLLSGQSTAKGGCDQIQAELEAKKAEQQTAWAAFSLQQTVIDALKDKLKEKVEDKVADMAGLGEAKRIYDDLSDKYEEAQKVLELLRSKSLSLESDVARLDAAYKVCVTGGVAAAAGKTFTLPTTNTLRGTVVENSLTDTAVLKKLDIKKTWTDGNWTLHDVRLSPKDASSFGKSLSDGPWYVHFWEEGSDTTLVVFKDKSFSIQQSKPETWTDAVEYGKSIGIPKEQLDFVRS